MDRNLRYSSIEVIFRNEILFARVCGGLLFGAKGLSYTAVAYKMFVMLFSKTLEGHLNLSQSQLSSTVSKAALQNVRLFWVAYNMIIQATTLVNFLTSIRFHVPILVVLKKRFDKRYLTTSNGDGGPGVDVSASASSLSSSSTQLTNASSADLIAGKQENIEERPLRHYVFRSKVKIVHYLMIINLILTAITFYSRDVTYARWFPQIIDDGTSRNSSGPSTLTNATISISGRSTILGKLPLLSRGSFTRFFNFNLLAMNFAQASFRACQIQGPMLTVLMIMAAITDIVYYSCVKDGFFSDEALQPSKYTIEARQRQRRRPLLTTEVLIHARDVLILLRCTMSLSFLMLLTYDLSRMVGVFCLFNISLSFDRFDTLFLISMDIIITIYNMALTSFGYIWLHSQVHELKRVVTEKHLLQAQRQGGCKISANLTLSHLERITIQRLATDIEALWPTDWFTPDLKSYLKYIIFVVTFVATLQQLVDASSRTEFKNI